MKEFLMSAPGLLRFGAGVHTRTTARMAKSIIAGMTS
jgi:hypothetical protein